MALRGPRGSSRRPPATHSLPVQWRVHMQSFLAPALFLLAGPGVAAAETSERTQASMSVEYGAAGNATVLLNGFPIIKSSFAGVNPYQAPLFWNGTAFARRAKYDGDGNPPGVRTEPSWNAATKTYSIQYGWGAVTIVHKVPGRRFLSHTPLLYTTDQSSWRSSSRWRWD